ncbi:DNA mismatch repair protein MutT [Nocardioides sp. Soil797]|nr:DNA mismatch repair protein MutT [Nocardioides sp. Soil797]
MDTRPASYVVAIEDGSILLAHWNENGHTGWTLPGGGMEDYESTQETAIREFREETGLDVELDGLLGVDVNYVAPERRISGTGPLRGVRVVHAGHVIGGELTNEINGTTDECRWIPLEEVAALDTVSLVDVAMEMLAAAK